MNSRLHISQPFSKSLNILYYNARSLLPKLDELSAIAEVERPDVICIVESWLSAEILNCEVSIESYEILRLDRNRHGGGLVMYIHNSLSAKVVLSGDNVELLVVSVSPFNVSCKFCISLFYRPPSSSLDIFDTLSFSLQSLDPSVYNCFVLTGDFNVDYFCTHSPLFKRLDNCLSPFSLCQLVKSATHTSHNGTSTLIDLVFLSKTLQSTHCTTTPPLANSDHNGVQLMVKHPSADFSKPRIVCERVFWRYASADFELANDLIASTDWDSLLTDNVNDSLSIWQNKFMGIMDQCIPKCSLSKARNLPWLSKLISRHIRQKKLLFKQAKKSGSMSLTRKYKHMRNKVTSMIRKAKADHIRSIEADPKKFWKAVKHLGKQKTSIPMLSCNGTTACSSSEKANMLNDHFSQCFNRSMPALTSDDVDQIDAPSCPDEFLCSVDNVASMLLNLEIDKSNGPDGISARMLKHTASSIAPSVANLFNQSIRTGCFPDHWKLSNVVPIPKSSTRGNPNNYRPISLLSILSKLLERQIHHLLSDHLSSTNGISDNQWGFQSGKGTVCALLATTHEWFQLLEAGNEVCAVFFDLKKAFDSVPHRALLDKLHEINLHPALIKWICSYLAKRTQQVVVNGETSGPTCVVSGVPQGSVLGPLLFIIFIDGVNSVSLSACSHLSLYADDMLLYKLINSASDYDLLQEDIDALAAWVSAHFLSFNPSKCKYMLVSRKVTQSDPPALLLGSTAIERVDSFKYLGVTLFPTSAGLITWI